MQSGDILLILVAISVLIILFLVIANQRTYALFAFDKRQAEIGGLRVPEWMLLDAAARGGWIGAKLAQRRLRHKTRKEPFRSQLNGIGQRQGFLVVVLIVAGCFAPRLAPDLVRALAERDLFSSMSEGARPDRDMPRRFGPGS